MAPLANFTGMLLRSAMRDGRRVGAHRVLGVADLRGAGRQREILGVDRIDDVERRQALGLQLGGIEVDHDLAVACRRPGSAE